MKKANTKELGKFFPAVLILRGERFVPCLIPSPALKMFLEEEVDLEDLFIDGTHSEGRVFFGGIKNGELVKYNENQEWEDVIRFFQVYDERWGIESIVARRCSDLDNPIYYFLS